LVKKLLECSNLFGYGEIINPYYRSSTLLNIYSKIPRENFKTVSIKSKDEVFSALRSFFSEDENTIRKLQE